MEAGNLNPKVDFFFNKATQWKAAYAQLRSLALGCGLAEDLKWGCPCYTHQGNNVVLIHGFKDYCALLFFKGALMGNADGLLIQQTANVQSARQMRFTSLSEVATQEAIIKAHIYEAIEIEKAGLKVTLKKTSDYTIPDEFQQKLDTNPALKTAFEALTPGRQKAYLFHFGQAKQASTRLARVEKFIPKILEGKGLED
ncbi:YdeI/OmpD-associated family protein [Emticicia fluvialis]|uniref:YdeI/OmpD-associated family protein n=1 Tax=Emticicia fluvialis TaxID=2974474 RepID=UPI00216608E1|nr:YdeI family protein [Emticicia fluvialis]